MSCSTSTAKSECTGTPIDPQRISSSPSIPPHIAMRPRVEKPDSDLQRNSRYPWVSRRRRAFDVGTTPLLEDDEGRLARMLQCTGGIARAAVVSPDTHGMIRGTSLVERDGSSPTRRSSDSRTTTMRYWHNLVRGLMHTANCAAVTAASGATLRRIPRPRRATATAVTRYRQPRRLSQVPSC